MIVEPVANHSLVEQRSTLGVAILADQDLSWFIPVIYEITGRTKNINVVPVLGNGRRPFPPGPHFFDHLRILSAGYCPPAGLFVDPCDDSQG